MTMESTTSESTEANTTEPTEVAMEITSDPEPKPKKGILKQQGKRPKNASVQFSSEVKSVTIKRVISSDSEDVAPKRQKQDGLDGESTDLPELFPTSSKTDEYGRIMVEKSHHTLESDEEDEEDPETKRYDISKLKCMEQKTIKYDGDIKITPFNMDEELEEGDFDNQGNFVFDETKKDESDAWEKSVDWEKIAREEKEKGSEEEESSDDEDYDIEPVEPVDINAGYKAIEQTIEKLKPNQTVNKYLTSLQNKRPTPAEERKLRYECKRKNVPYEDPQTPLVNEMTLIAQPFVDAGIADFDTTKEALQEKLDAHNTSLDMFD